MSRWGIVVLVLLAACGNEHRLSVDVRTDLVAVLELDSIEVELDGVERPPQRLEISRESNLVRGVRASRFDDLAPGGYEVVVRFIARGGEVVGERRVRVQVDQETVITAVFTRSCVGVVCGDVNAGTCNNGVCVDSACAPENPSACGATFCATDAACSASAADCAAAECSEGACLQVAVVGACGVDEACLPESGCAQLEMSMSDAGDDSGPDAGPDLGPDMSSADTDAADVSIDAGPPSEVTRALSPWNGWTTGSLHALGDLANPPLRPRLSWAATEGADVYRVQMSRECAPGSFRSCAFASPEIDELVEATEFRPDDPLPVSAVPPVGARYTWRVQACRTGGSCTDWTEPRYLDVGREHNDYNGDGYADIAISALGVTSGAHIFYGGTLLSESPSQTLVVPGERVGNTMAALGDLDADGFADLAASGDSGTVQVWRGSASGLNATAMVLDFAGENVLRVGAAGDINADGFADLLVGASNNDAPEYRAGEVFVHLGSSDGFTIESTRVRSPASRELGNFGRRTVGVGDVNGDGTVDWVVSEALSEDPARRERFHLYLGASDVATLPAQTRESPSSARTGFAEVIAGGDFDADGHNDLVVGAEFGEAPERTEGVVYIYRGDADGISESPDLTLDNPNDVPNGRFGHALSAGGDVDADGYVDLVVGAWTQSDPEAEEGAIFLFRGGAAGVSESPSAYLDHPLDQSFGWFGSDVRCVGDVDGDGNADLAIASFYQSNPELFEGGAYLFLGRTTGIADTPDLAYDNPLNEENGGFGQAIAGR